MVTLQQAMVMALHGIGMRHPLLMVTKISLIYLDASNSNINLIMAVQRVCGIQAQKLRKPKVAAAEQSKQEMHPEDPSYDHWHLQKFGK